MKLEFPHPFDDSAMPPIGPSLGKCIWCGERDGTTRDHLIPRWYTRKVSPGEPTIKCPSCPGCNRKKGPLPPMLFHQCRPRINVSRVMTGYDRATTEWGLISEYFGRNILIPDSLLEYVGSQMVADLSVLGLHEPVYFSDTDYTLFVRARIQPG